jgi:hypothetical protein
VNDYELDHKNNKDADITEGPLREAAPVSQAVLQQGNVIILPKSDPGTQKLVLPGSKAIKVEVRVNLVSDPGRQDIGETGFTPEK